MATDRLRISTSYFFTLLILRTYVRIRNRRFKLSLVALAPLGKEIVSTRDPRAAAGVVSF